MNSRIWSLSTAALLAYALTLWVSWQHMASHQGSHRCEHECEEGSLDPTSEQASGEHRDDGDGQSIPVPPTECPLCSLALSIGTQVLPTPVSLTPYVLVLQERAREPESDSCPRFFSPHRIASPRGPPLSA